MPCPLWRCWFVTKMIFSVLFPNDFLRSVKPIKSTLAFIGFHIPGKSYNVHGHKYVALPAPSLHDNNRECGGKEGNIIVSRDFNLFHLYEIELSTWLLTLAQNFPKVWRSIIINSFGANPFNILTIFLYVMKFKSPFSLIRAVKLPSNSLVEDGSD